MVGTGAVRESIVVIVWTTCWAVAEVTTMMTVAVQTIYHAMMRSACWPEVTAPTVVVAVSTYHMPCMGTTIAGIESRTTENEVVAVRIAGVDAKVPETITPVKWTVEVAGCYEGIPL